MERSRGRYFSRRDVRMMNSVNGELLKDIIEQIVIETGQVEFKEGNFAYGDHTDFSLLHQFGQKDSFRMSSRRKGHSFWKVSSARLVSRAVRLTARG